MIYRQESTAIYTKNYRNKYMLIWKVAFKYTLFFLPSTLLFTFHFHMSNTSVGHLIIFLNYTNYIALTHWSIPNSKPLKMHIFTWKKALKNWSHTELLNRVLLHVIWFILFSFINNPKQSTIPKSESRLRKTRQLTVTDSTLQGYDNRAPNIYINVH